LPEKEKKKKERRKKEEWKRGVRYGLKFGV